MNYIAYLLKKLLKKKSNYFFILILLFLLGLLNWNNERMLSGDMSPLVMNEQRIADYDSYIVSNGNNEEANEGLRTQQAFLKNMSTALQNNNDQSYLKNNIDLLQWQLDNIGDSLARVPSVPGITNTADKQLLISKEQYRLKTGLEIDPYEVKGFHFSYRAIQTFAPVIFTAIILLVIVPLSTSYFKKNLNIEKVYPHSSFSITFKRTLSTWFAGVGTLLLIYFLCFFVGTIRNGAGSFSYPVLVYLENDYWIEPLWKVLGKATLLAIFLYLSISLMVQIIGQVTKNSLVTLFLSLLIVIAPYVSFLQNSQASFSRFIPTFYLNPLKIAEGITGALLKQPEINWHTGVLVNLIFAGVLFSISVFIEMRD